jgi:hypothetical protein
MKILGMMLVLAATVLAQDSGAPVPEIDGGTAVSGLALLSGALLLVKSRFRK